MKQKFIISKENTKKIITSILVIVILIVAIFFLAQYTSKRMVINKQIENSIKESETIYRFTRDLDTQSASDEIIYIKADLDATDFSNIDEGLLK